MARTRLTATAVAKLAPPKTGRKELYDADVPGLTLRVTPTGVKSWSFTYRRHNRSRRLTLGQFPGVSLKLARDKARKARESIQRGQDPVEEQKEQEREQARYGFTACAEDFVERYCKPNLKTWKKVESCLQRFAIPEFGDQPVRDIRRRDLVDLLDRVAAKTPGQANHLRAFLSKLFKWLLEREVVEVNPVAGIAPRHKIQPRNRVLTEPEIIALWTATERLGGPFGACTRLLLLTGMRRDEAGHLRWDELEDGFASLPGSRMKGGRDFRVPLSTGAQELVDGMPPLGEFVFTTNGRTPISGWSWAKRQLDAFMAEELGEPVPDWRFHDLRRTLASGLAMRGTRSEVIKRILGHAANANDVTAAHYNWHSYDEEAATALQDWADYLQKLG